MSDQELIDTVLKQVKEDVEIGDVTALEELLKTVPEEKLKEYLPEQSYNNLAK